MFSLLLYLTCLLNFGAGSLLPSNEPLKGNRTVPIVDIVITVKTDIKYVRSCVNSLIRHDPDSRLLQQRVVFVDDGSPASTLTYEADLCRLEPEKFFCTQTRGKEKGYTWAVEKGMHHVAEQGFTESDAVVLLNSDTVVTEGWLVSMFDTLISKKDLMIVGPLSNAATWQSVPNLDLADNSVPLGLGIDSIAKDIRRYAKKKNIGAVSITIINGFCFMFKRQVLAHITGFDTKHFGPGYGEEVDFCLRNFKKGFDAQIVPNSYVFHTKTASFPSDEKKELTHKAHIVLDSKYSDVLDDFKKTRLVSRSKLTHVANEVSGLYSKYYQRFSAIQHPSTLFVIPEKFSAKAFIEILRIVFYMRSYNINARVEAIDWRLSAGGVGTSIADLLSTHFPDLSLADRMAVIGVHAEDFSSKSSSMDSFEANSNTPRALRLKADVVLAVSVDAVEAVQRICHFNEFSQPAYLLSGYSGLSLSSLEDQTPPLKQNRFKHMLQFFEAMNISLSDQLTLAGPVHSDPNLRSYLVGENSNSFNVNFILPHIANDMYFISPHDLKIKTSRHFGKGANVFNVLVCTSSAEHTWLRQTFQSLKKFLIKFKQVSVTVLFMAEDVDNTLKNVISDVVQNHKVSFITANFSRPLSDLATIYRRSDLFLDISSLYGQIDEQILLEVMACGCVVALPYDVDSSNHIRNSNPDDYYTMDVTDSEDTFEKLSLLLETSVVRKKFIAKGIEISAEFTPEEATLTFLELISPKTNINLFGLDSSAFVSLFFAIVIVSLVVIGIIYLRPASNPRKKIDF